MIPQSQPTMLSGEKLASSILLLVSLITMAVMCYHGLFSPIDYDEAYNLQVVDNLAKWNGYASYGALRSNGLWSFDPHITTGPVILGPLGLLWYITNGSILAIRIFMLLFLLLYIAGLYYLFDHKRKILLIPAIAVSSSLCIIGLPVGTVLGELPAAAAIVWSAWAVSKNKPLIAGLAVGLAVQIKLIYGLAGAAVLVSWLISTLVTRQPHWLKNIFLTGIFALAPTIFFEIYRFFSFSDFDAYLFSLDEFRSFLRTQNINNNGTWLNPNAIGAKFVGLYQLVPFLGWLAAGIFGAIFFAGSVYKVINPSQSALDQKLDSEPYLSNSSGIFVAAAYIGLGVAGILMLIGWVTQSSQFGSRQGLPFILLFLPTFFAFGGYYYFEIKNILIAGKAGWIIKSIAFVGLALLLVALSNKIYNTLRDSSVADALKEQHKVTELIKQSGAKSLSVDGWWQNPEYQLLSGIPGMPVRAGAIPQLLVVQDYQVFLTGTNWDAYLNKCADVIYSSPRTLLCWPHDVISKNVALKVLDWEPRFTQVGVVPNEQPDGGVGLSIKIEKINIAELGPIKVFFSDRPAWINYQDPSGELITASIPPRLFKKLGQNEVSIKQLSTGRIFHVGYFDVKQKP